MVASTLMAARAQTAVGTEHGAAITAVGRGRRR